MRSFAQEAYLPGVSPPTAVLRLDGEDFVLPVPGTWALLDIAANYAWDELVPYGLVEGDRELLLDWLADPGHPATWHRLHIAVQPVGSYLYGLPFFTAARVCANLLEGFTLFRTWSVTNVHRSLESASAAEWCAAALSWLVHQGAEESDRKDTWAQLTIPGRLPSEVPGVVPEWMA